MLSTRSVIAACLLLGALALTARAQELTCGYPFAADPGATHRITMEGTEVAVDYGVNADFGMVGTEFTLRASDVEEGALDLCEARSAGGAGWQHSAFVTTHDGDELIFNQAAGNAVGFQWGYGTEVVRRQAPARASLTAADWMPCCWDTFNGVAASPCDETASAVAHAQVEAALETVAVPGRGQVVRLTRKTTFLSREARAWRRYFPVDAFYLDKAVARAAGMEVYLQGESGWRVGPIRPYENWTAADLADAEGAERGAMNPTPPWGGSWCNVAPDVDQVVWVLTLGEKRIACGLRGLPSGLSLRVIDTVYCGEPGNDACGSIDIIIFHPQEDSVIWPKGSKRSYGFAMTVGTVAQMQALGYYCE